MAGGPDFSGKLTRYEFMHGILNKLDILSLQIFFFVKQQVLIHLIKAKLIENHFFCHQGFEGRGDIKILKN